MTTASLSAPPEASSWSSTGLPRGDALRQWQHWAERTIAPITVSVRDDEPFVAAWRSRDVSQLRMLELFAPAQSVVHSGTGNGSGGAAPSIQLVYARRGALKTRIGHDVFTLTPGEFVLLDNTRFYQMDMESRHEAIDLMMPQSWFERWLPDPEVVLARPISARAGWGLPLGSLIETMARNIGDDALSDPMMADRIGSLLMLATRTDAVVPSRSRGQLTRCILRRIDGGFADPELTAGRVCGELGISKRYLQALLAARGTSFVQELTAIRLERAGALLADPRMHGLAVAEVAFRCGFLDAGYFARQFARRFGASPRSWRQALRS